MKKYFYSIIALFFVQINVVYSQCSDLVVNTTTYSATGLTTCGFGDDFSSADACGSSYMGGDDYVIVYTPTTTGPIDITLTNTDTWVGLFVTDLCPNVAGATCINSSTASGGNPSITGLNVTAGTTYYITISTWPSPQCTAFDIDITTAAPPPANDECSGAYPVTVGSFNGGCVSLTSGTIASATASSQDATACSGTEDDDVWFSFVAPASGVVNINLLNVAGSTTDLYHSVWSGTCPTLSLVTGSCSDPNNSNLSGLTPGQTYYLRVYSWTSTAGQNTTFDVCIEDGACPSLPANDECSGATPVTVGTFNGGCVSTVSSTIACATASSQDATACGGTEDDDVWFSFVAPASGVINIDLLNVAGSTTDLEHSVWSGTCPTLSLVTGSCSDPNNSNLSGLTPGQTYYLRVYSWTSTSGQNTTFDVCIEDGACPSLPANDECSGATPVTVTGLGATCSPVSSTIACATASAQDAAACSGTEDDDVWFSFVAPSSGALSISLTNVTGSTTDLYHSVWSGTCPTLSLVTGSCSDPNSSSLTGLTSGQTYFIRVYSWTSTAGQNSSFDVCLQETDACGGTGTNDFCNAPATLTQGVGTFSSSTASIYTSDEPANVNSVFCGSIENNSWYQFTASSTTETFNFTSVTNCTSGIQAEVYSVTYDANGCCSNFTSVSNCWNPSTATAGTVTATGLTVGQNYMLMIDGFGGDACDFTVSNWTGINILPVNILHFTGSTQDKLNLLTWTTASEENNDYFIIEKSFDGISYKKIGIVNGSGNSSSKIDYQFEDRDIQYKTVYYRLSQVDYNGEKKQIGLLAMERPLNDILIYPNPASKQLNFKFKKVDNQQYTVQYIDVTGRVVEEILIKNNTNEVVSNIFHTLNNGFYLVKIKDQNGNVLKTTSIVKN